MTAAPELTWGDLVKLLSPGGQKEILDFIAEVRQSRGEGWLAAIRAEYPFASWVVNLVANKTDDEALDEVCSMYPNMPIRIIVGTQIKALHAKLRFEIDRKR